MSARQRESESHPPLGNTQLNYHRISAQFPAQGQGIDPPGQGNFVEKGLDRKLGIARADTTKRHDPGLALRDQVLDVAVGYFVVAVFRRLPVIQRILGS